MALRLAIFGQAAFGRDVAVSLADEGHRIVGVYVPPDQNPERSDVLAAAAAERGWPLFRQRLFRRRGKAIPERVAEHRALEADLNVLPFTTMILPPEIIEGPSRGSLCFHPSLLPAYRGGSAIPWQIILGARETGVSVFRPDAGVDTGPIVLQRGGVPIGPNETAASLYFDKLYPLGVKAMLEAVSAVAAGTALYEPQPEQGASFQGLVTDAVARVDWGRPAAELDRLIRGCDPQPGARADLAGQVVRLYDCRLASGEVDATPGTVLGSQDGRLLVAARGARLSLGKLRVGDARKGPADVSGIVAGAVLA